MKTVLAMLVISSTVHAQVGPSMVIDPWTGDPHFGETNDDLVFINGGHDKRSDNDIDVFYWDSQGRAKFDKEETDPGFTLGYRLLTMDVGSELQVIDGELNDLAIAGAFRLSEGEEWEWTATLGAGTANDGHFSNGDAVYAIGNLNGSRTLDENSSLHVGLNYDGNRTFLPDVPLPYVMYRHRVDEKLEYTLGVPTSGVTWRPVERLVFEAAYNVPTNLSGSAEYFFTDSLGVFTEYRRTLDGFYIDERENTRLFYEMSRVSTGVHLIVKPWVDVRAGVGYAFDQEFSTGFDVRDLDTVARPSDEVMFFFTIQGTF